MVAKRTSLGGKPSEDKSSLIGSYDPVSVRHHHESVAELTALGVPVICVPSERRFDDQDDRAMESAAAFSTYCGIVTP
jgi:hypothetical protein